MFRKTYVILVLFLIVYIILNLFHPGGLMAYALASACWATLALVTIIVGDLEKIRSWTNRRITLMALFVAAFQIFILIDAGLINKFGESPLAFTPTAIAINLTLVTTTLLGTELSRAYLTKNLSRKRPALTLAAVTLLYTFTNVSILALINFQKPLVYSKLMGEKFLPALTESLLATYLALLSGPVASLAYRAPLQAFWWFCPILPDLPWGYKSLIGVMAPTIGFIAITQATTPADLRKAGMPAPRRPFPRWPGKGQTSLTGWIIISTLLVLAVWASTGLLGFYPTIPISGSMRPALDVGDVAMVIRTDPQKIQVGDIIQYWREEGMTLHRVVEVYQEGNTLLFITKGDANTAPDPDPVFPNQIRGKVVLTIPKIGWISVYLKTLITATWTFLTNNPTITYATLTAALAASTLGIHRYRNQPLRKIKRRLQR